MIRCLISKNTRRFYDNFYDNVRIFALLYVILNIQPKDITCYNDTLTKIARTRTHKGAKHIAVLSVPHMEAWFKVRLKDVKLS
jgi:hypothetical protein